MKAAKRANAVLPHPRMPVAIVPLRLKAVAPQGAPAAWKAANAVRAALALPAVVVASVVVVVVKAALVVVLAAPLAALPVQAVLAVVAQVHSQKPSAWRVTASCFSSRTIPWPMS